MFKRKFFIMSAVIVLVVPGASFGQEFAPGFPLDSLNPFSPDVINSVFDHSHPGKGFEDHRVDAYSGEVGMYHEYDDSKCYMVDESGTPVSLDGNYRGAHGKEYLCYDGHKGIDFKASASLVVAVDAGEIVKKVSVCPDEPMASCGEGFGNWFKIKHINGYTSIYAHLRTDGISGKEEGEHVEKGEPLGYSGNSGHSYGEHLHFEIRKDIGRDPIKVDPYMLWKREDFQSPSGFTCYPELPAPILAFGGTAWPGLPYTYYRLLVSNWQVFPDELFELTSALPPCGLNSNSSRSWVNIYDNLGNYLYGFCGLPLANNLNDIWFAILKGETLPASVYISIIDRGCNITYTSDSIQVNGN